MHSLKITEKPGQFALSSYAKITTPYLHYYLFMLIVVPALLSYVIWVSPQSSAHSLPNEPGEAVNAAVAGCGEDLPLVAWLGEGPGNYVLNPGFDTFIVKRLPFKFFLESGQVNANGNTVYHAKEGERVWACDGNCQLPAVYHAGYALGTLQPGTIVKLVVIDDDGPEQNNDQRRNWWALNDPSVPYQVVEEQTMVEYLTWEVPEAGVWYYYANDSIGIAAQCIEPAPPPTVTPMPTVTETPTASATVTPTATELPTGTETPTETPIPATPMPRPSLTATPTPSPTSTATAANTATATATPMDTATPTPTSTATQVSTPTGNSTPPVEATMTITPTLIVKEPPTALQLLYFQAHSRSEKIVLQWETTLEIDFAGFQLWRSSNGQRGDAQLISANLIAGRGTAGTGASYTFEDIHVSRGVTYTYWLRQVDTNGAGLDIRSTTAALSYQLFVPLIAR